MGGWGDTPDLCNGGTQEVMSLQLGGVFPCNGGAPGAHALVRGTGVLALQLGGGWAGPPQWTPGSPVPPLGSLTSTPQG